jgi:hypothetical protein
MIYQKMTFRRVLPLICELLRVVNLDKSVLNASNYV